jgi:hypothetical protein
VVLGNLVTVLMLMLILLAQAGVTAGKCWGVSAGNICVVLYQYGYRHVQATLASIGEYRWVWLSVSDNL